MLSIPQVKQSPLLRYLSSRLSQLLLNNLPVVVMRESIVSPVSISTGDHCHE